jgi:hypothetical protein
VGYPAEDNSKTYSLTLSPGGMLKALKFLTGLALLPAGLAATRGLWELMLLESAAQPDTAAPQVWALPAGFCCWLFLFFCTPKPFRTYVLGHELTHALWGLCLGAKVSRMKVSKKGGWVELSKTNVLISLAPYFFPLYTVLVIALYLLLGQLLDVQQARPFWLGAVGFTWAFHLTFTLHMLTSHQPDIASHGRLFSYTLIYLFNLLGMLLWLTAVGAPSLDDLAETTLRQIPRSYRQTGAFIRETTFFLKTRIGTLQ